MILKLDRPVDWCYPDCTQGNLYLDGHFECFTLEDTLRADGVKIFGETCIPFGQYNVTIDWSNRFGRLLPLVHDVKNFVGIRIHPGNSAKDTEGCILVGTERGVKSVKNSRVAFNALFEKMQAALRNGDKISLYIPRHLPLTA